MMILFAAGLISSNDAHAQWYVGVALGGNASRDVALENRSNDRASICDEYINPRALAIPSCTAPSRGAGDGWLAPFDPGTGFSTEVEIGFRVASRWRFASVFARDVTNFDQTVSSTDATGADFDKISNELSVGEETLGNVTSHALQLIVVRDWPNKTRWTPYAGIGTTALRMRKDFSWLWARSADPADITTGLDQPNAAEIRRNLAATVSAGRRTIHDTMFGYALFVGIERELSESVSVGVKAQWRGSGEFKSEAYGGDLLRSHPPNLRLDGSEPVSTWSDTNDTGRFSTLFSIRYAIR